MQAPVTLLISDTRLRTEIAALKLQTDVQIIADIPAEGAADTTADAPLPVRVVDFENGCSLDSLIRLKAEQPDVYLIAVCQAGRLQTLQLQLLHVADEVIGRPFQIASMEAALARAGRWQQMQRRAAISSMDRSTAEIVTTERFLGVRQIVDKMSSFVGQVASDVHGGVKYFNELPYFISIHSPEGKLLAANPTYLRYLGNRLYDNSWDIYVGKRATRHSCPVGRTVRTGATLETRALARYASGARVPVIVHTAPIFDNDGEIVLVLEIFAGTIEIDRLAEEVRHTQQRYQQLFDAVPSNIAVLDRRLRITALNRRFTDNYGRHLGVPFFEVLRPAGFPAFRDPVSLTVKDGEPHQGELVVTDLHSQSYNVMAWTAPIKTRAGKLVQVLVIFADITQTRQLQDNLSSLGLMIGTISHDLKGCLTGLDAGLYLIDTGFYRDQPGRIEEGLDVSRLMVDRVRKMVQDILYYTKERDLELEQVDVEAFAYDVVANVDHRIRAADIRFDFDIEKGPGQFTVDAALLRSALINIFENAIEACIEDERDLMHVIGFNVYRYGQFINIDIFDNGPGIDEKQLKHIFDMFYSSKGKKGTGLGLFITQKVVLKHGGEITAQSKPGAGARFTMRLPLKPPAEGD